MPVPVRITIRGIEHSTALDTNIRERCEKLEQLCPQLLDVEVRQLTSL